MINTSSASLVMIPVHVIIASTAPQLDRLRYTSTDMLTQGSGFLSSSIHDQLGLNRELMALSGGWLYRRVLLHILNPEEACGDVLNRMTDLLRVHYANGSSMADDCIFSHLSIEGRFIQTLNGFDMPLCLTWRQLLSYLEQQETKSDQKTLSECTTLRIFCTAVPLEQEPQMNHGYRPQMNHSIGVRKRYTYEEEGPRTAKAMRYAQPNPEEETVQQRYTDEASSVQATVDSELIFDDFKQESNEDLNSYSLFLPHLSAQSFADDSSSETDDLQYCPQNQECIPQEEEFSQEQERSSQKEEKGTPKTPAVEEVVETVQQGHELAVEDRMNTDSEVVSPECNELPVLLKEIAPPKSNESPKLPKEVSSPKCNDTPLLSKEPTATPIIEKNIVQEKTSLKELESTVADTVEVKMAPSAETTTKTVPQERQTALDVKPTLETLKKDDPKNTTSSSSSSDDSSSSSSDSSSSLESDSESESEAEKEPGSKLESGKMVSPVKASGKNVLPMKALEKHVPLPVNISEKQAPPVVNVPEKQIPPAIHLEPRLAVNPSTPVTPAGNHVNAPSLSLETPTQQVLPSTPLSELKKASLESSCSANSSSDESEDSSSTSSSSGSSSSSSSSEEEMEKKNAKEKEQPSPKLKFATSKMERKRNLLPLMALAQDCTFSY